ncbi:MAG: ferredoxin [Desulfocapsaceae bacterium]|nr:ferredoxin [Desulfocapsaceae bacterium]
MGRKYPVVDIGKCTLCGGCIEVAPMVFRYNEGLNFIEVVDLDKYPEKEVNEAIKNCPVDCIEWEEDK